MIDLEAWGLTEDSALFYNVDGIPATIGHPRYPGCMAWDELPPRPFRVESLQRNGWKIEFDGFVKLLFARVGED
jgi:hypothetical protein